MPEKEPHPDFEDLRPLLADWQLAVPEAASWEDLRSGLSARINAMILDHFEGLVALLYRIDVSEKKVREVLRTHPQAQASLLLADLILERLVQKWTWRQKFSSRKDSENAGEDERW